MELDRHMGKDAMNIPIGAQVYCGNELCGRSTHVVLNLMTNQVTYVVVEQNGALPTYRVVPIEWLEASTAHQLVLRCSKAELAESRPLEMESTSCNVAGTALGRAHVSPPELVVGQGAWVEAWDGYVGLVDEFLIDPRTCCVTHVILHEAHLWGEKAIAVPVSAVSRIEENRVRLALNIDSVQGLPTVPMQRHSALAH
jgi:uncharacterized protein YrrD